MQAATDKWIEMYVGVVGRSFDQGSGQLNDAFYVAWEIADKPETAATGGSIPPGFSND